MRKIFYFFRNIPQQLQPLQMGSRRTVVADYGFDSFNTNSELISWKSKKIEYVTYKDSILSSKRVVMQRSAYEEEKVLELDKQLSLLEQSQSVMNKEISEMKEDVRAMNNKLDTIVEKLSDKFASKRVESAMKWLITAICWGVVTAVLALVINK